MIHKLATALLLLALAVPFANALATGDGGSQINAYPEGLFYSAGRSYLGIVIQDVTSDRVNALKLKEERGVEVTMVDQDAPAAKAGLKEHDVILEFNGTKVESEEQVRRLIRETPPGRTVTLGISRDGSPMTVSVQLGDRAKIAAENDDKTAHTRIEWPRVPPSFEFNLPMDIRIYGPTLGIQVDPVGKQLGEFFGVKNGQGLLVKSVEKGSVGEKAGLKAGDVIVRAENEKIADRTDLRRVLRAHRSGGKITLGIVRDKREQNINVELPAHKSQGSSDSSDLDLTLPDIQSIDDLQSKLREMQPKLEEQLKELQPRLEKQLKDLQPQLLKAQAALNSVKPEVKAAMEKAQVELERARKQLEKERKEFRKWQMI